MNDLVRPNPAPGRILYAEDDPSQDAAGSGLKGTRGF
jgi:hypothetical protein